MSVLHAADYPCICCVHLLTKKNGLKLSSAKKPNQYTLQVIIDDVDKYTVNLNGPNTENAPQEVLWGVQLVEGNHTFQAINLKADPDRPYVAFASLTITTGQSKFNHGLAPLRVT
jgi:hypothetical protein